MLPNAEELNALEELATEVLETLRVHPAQTSAMRQLPGAVLELISTFREHCAEKRLEEDEYVTQYEDWVDKLACVARDGEELSTTLDRAIDALGEAAELHSDASYKELQP